MQAKPRGHQACDLAGGFFQGAFRNVKDGPLLIFCKEVGSPIDFLLNFVHLGIMPAAPAGAELVEPTSTNAVEGVGVNGESDNPALIDVKKLLWGGESP